jgi:probable rRNA maturation factor
MEMSTDQETLAMSNVSVDIQIASKVTSVPGQQEIQSWVEDAINEVRNDRNCDCNCEVSVRVVDEDEGCELNGQYRQADKATNVLSFPADREALHSLPQEVPRALGDIVICGPIVEREAAQQHKKNSDHWAHLLVHGTLHLLGHDHESDAEALEMEAIETRILGRRGVGDPYAA